MGTHPYVCFGRMEYLQQWPVLSRDETESDPESFHANEQTKPLFVFLRNIALFFSFELTTNEPGGGQDVALQHASRGPTPTRFTSSKVSSQALKQKLRQQIINGT